MDSRKLRASAADKLAEAKKIREAAADGPLSAEDFEKVNALLAEHKSLIAQAEQAEELEQREAEMAATIDPLAPEETIVRRTDQGVESQEDRERCGWNSLGEFAAAVATAYDPAQRRMDERLQIGAAVSGMSQGVGAEGGFAVPPAFSNAIWDGLREDPDSILGQTDQYPITGESLSLPANAETSRADGSRYGGIQGFWKAEADQMSGSKPKLRQVKLEPQELYVFAYMTNKLILNNLSALDRWLTGAMSSEIAFKVGDAIFNGNGAGQPLGILNGGGLVSVAKESGQVADTFTQNNVAAMYARMHARARAGARWYINQDVDPQLLTMVTVVKDVAGTENVGGFSAGLYNADRDTLMGLPIQRIEYAQTLGDQGDVYLANLGFYATGTRGGPRAATSMHLRFDFDETAFRVIFEVDGQPWLHSPLTPKNGTNTLSAFVALDVRA